MQQHQWPPQQLSSTLITRNVQPLLSLGQALNSMGMSPNQMQQQQQHPYSFNQFVQLTSGHNALQSRG